MPNFSGDISGFVVGDDVEVYRTIGNVPAGETIVKAWLTVKASITDLDGAALIQKAITASMNATEGVIADTGGSGTAIVRFFLTSTNTAALGNPARGVGAFPYDIQLKTSSGKIFTAEIGTITAVAQVTQTTT